MSSSSHHVHHSGLSYLHNLCRFGEANEWSNEPLEPGWASPLTVSGLTRVGRGDRLLRASIAPPSRILSAGPVDASVFSRRIGGSAIGMLSRRSCVASSWRRASFRPAVPEPGTTATTIASLAVVAACCRWRKLRAGSASRHPVQSTNSPAGSWHFESQDGKMELVAPGTSRGSRVSATEGMQLYLIAPAPAFFIVCAGGSR